MSGLIQRIKRGLIHLFFRLCRVFPVDRNKVLFLSYYGKGFGDNGKAIALALLEQNPKLNLVWAAEASQAHTVPEGIRFVEYCSLRYYLEMATAAVWVDNCRKGSEIRKRKGQFYLQTWHGMVALKRIERDVEAQLGRQYVADAKHDAQMTDLMLSGCDFFTGLCRRSFWYDGPVLECGSPRLDVLFSQTQEENLRVKQALGISPEQRVVLYAPTFRADGNTDCYLQSFEAVLDALEAKTGASWVWAVRLHPNVAGKAGAIPNSPRAVNATDWPDLYSLLPAVDLVISDYSSVMFDAALIRKPVFLYATDAQDYAGDRGFYFDLEELPFPLARSREELMSHMAAFDETAYGAALDRFHETLGYHEKGAASRAVAEKIMDVLSHG